MDFVAAAKALGARRPADHDAPHAARARWRRVVVAATLGVADAVVIEAALSFLGFGIAPPEASLGNMLTKATGLLLPRPRC